jgi:hypothetical protein
MGKRWVLLLVAILCFVAFFFLGISSEEKPPAGLSNEFVIAASWIYFLSGIYLLISYAKPSDPS